jgi:hypothetical protein
MRETVAALPDRAPKVPRWDALDPEVQRHVERVRALDVEARKAVDEARKASEAVAEAERNDRQRRSAALAEGKADPGKREATIAKAERAAAEAAERADVLSGAVAEAHIRLAATIAQRSPEWQDAARRALDEAARELREAVEAVAIAYETWRIAGGQVALASDERARRKGRTVGADATLAGLRDRADQPLFVSQVVDALRGVTIERVEAPEVEAESVEVHGGAG